MGDETSEMEPQGDGRDRTARLAENTTAFAGLTGDFYRGELERTASWRGRLDQTTNWAVVVVAAILTWAFSSGSNPHYVILIGVFAVAAFLVMEATRYREYDVWRDRVRTLQTDLYAAMYAPDSARRSDWEREIGDDLRNPQFHLSFREALSHRLRRSYLPLLLILLAAWIARITAFEASETWRETASILHIDGAIVVGVIGVLYFSLLALAVASATGGRIREFQK